MRRVLIISVIFLSSVLTLWAASKQHVIAYGRVMKVKLFIGPSEDHTIPMTVKPLYVDGKLKEFTTGDAHDVTDRLFVIRRAYRLNNTLPDDEDPHKLPNWIWQQGTWLMVDRDTGRITRLNLPDFDPFYSQASWFRDYVAYCGYSGDQTKLYAVVAQLGTKKPLLHNVIGVPSGGEEMDADCAAPTWQRQPTKVTFAPKKGAPTSYTVFGHAADVAPGSDEEEK